MNDRNSNNYENASESDSKIFGYLKEHPSVMIACISAIIATASFAMNAVVYFVDRRYFAFWGFDIAQSEYKNPNQIYVLVISVVFVLSIILIQKYCDELFGVYLRRTECVPVLKAILKDLKITIKKNNKTKRQRKSTHSVAHQSTIHNKNDKPEHSISIDDMLSIIRELKSTIRKEKRNAIKELYAIQIPSGIAMILLGMFYFGTVGTAKLSFWICVLLSISCSVLNVLLNQLLSYVLIRTPFNHKIKEIAKTNPHELLSLLDEKTKIEIGKISLRLKDILKTDTIKDSRLRSHIVSIAIAVVVYYIVFFFSANGAQVARKEFPICYIDMTPYVIVYQSPGTYYLNQAVIDNTHITIDTRIHRIIISNDTSYTNTKFENVTIQRD